MRMDSLISTDSDHSRWRRRLRATLEQIAPGAKRAFAVAGACLAGVIAQAGTFKADFNTDPTSILNFGGSLWDGSTTTRTGGANWRNTGGAGPMGGTTNGPVSGVNNDGFLQLTFASSDCSTPNSTYLVGGVLFNDFDNGLTVGGFTFDCDLRIGNGNPNPADGFSISYMRNSDPILAALTAGDTFPEMNNAISANGGQFSDNGNGGDASLPEEGTTTGLSIGFDMWDSGNYTIPPGGGAVGTEANGLTHDSIGLDIRVDGVLVATIPMPNGTTQVTYSPTNGGQTLPATDTTGANGATDATSIETGPNDGTGCDTTLKWVHFKVDLTTNGVLNVFWKNKQILTNMQVQYFPSPGRLLMAARVGGNTANIEVDNVQITTIPAAKPQLAIGAANLTFTGGSILVYDAAPSIADTNTIQLKVNGAAVTPNSVTKTNGTTTIGFDTGTLFASGSTNTVSLTIKDTQNPAQTITADRSVVAATYVSGLDSYAQAAGSADTTKPGFLVHPYATTEGNPNTVQWTEEQLAGLHGPNIADLSGADANGFYSVPDVINWDINTTAADGHFNPPDYQDVLQPGWVLDTNSKANNSSEEVLTYLSFPAAGLYTMGVNSDDGFKVTTGVAPRAPFASTVLGEFSAGRGASDTLFSFNITKAGVYPFRLIYENGGGGANCEWFTQTNGVDQLVNDTTNAVKAYQALKTPANVPVYVSAVVPVPGASFTVNTNIFVQITDGTTAQLNPASVQVWLNGATQQVTINKSGSVTSVTTPSGQLPAGLSTVQLIYGDNGSPAVINTNTYTFIGTFLTATMAATNIDTTKPGFWVHPYQTTNANPNTLAWTEEQLQGLHGPNLANLSKADTNGFIVFTGVVNWDEDTNAANGNFNAPDHPDTVPPGWVLTTTGATPTAPNSTEEVYTYLYFPTNGTYMMGVNSDDGFKVTAGQPLKGTNAMVFGSFDAGRGAADTIFPVTVTSPGYYPFRLLYENGGGGANCEWFTQLPDGTDVLINDPSAAGAIKAYLGPEPGGTSITGPGPVFNTPTQSNGVITITWTGTGTLQEATNLTGQASDWFNVSPQPTGTSVTINTSNAPPHAFYRLKQ